jgi:hypothetical protein
MSGGHFDYHQYKITEIADEIENIIKNNETENEYRELQYENEEVIKLYRDAVEALRIAQVYAQRIDWYICGDDGEENFKSRLKEDLSKLLLLGEK